jgi:hypothetical protein
MASRESEGPAVYWVDEAADVEIRDGIVCWALKSGGTSFLLRATPAVLLESIRRSTAVYNRFAAHGSAHVAALPRKERRHEH